jgi:hypothetical protein
VGKIARDDCVITTAGAGDFAHPTLMLYGSTFFAAKYTCSGPGNLRLLTSAA